jgi:hypothetical protein
VTALLFFHIVAGFFLVGSIGAAALALRAGHPLAWKAAAFFVVPAGVLTIILGEALASDQNAKGGWLDAGRALAFALLLGGIALTIVARRRPRAASYVAAALLLIGLATVFVMSARP